MNKTLLEMVKEVIEGLDKMVDELDKRRNELRKEYKKLYDETIRLEDILDNETFEDETRRRKLAIELDIVDDKATNTANKLDEIYDYRESLCDAYFYLKEAKETLETMQGD